MKTLTDLLEQNALLEKKTRARHLEKERRDRIQQEKRRSRLYFAVGNLVCRYFPSLLDLSQLEISTETMPELARLDRVLNYLSSHHDVLDEMLNDPDREG